MQLEFLIAKITNWMTFTFRVVISIKHGSIYCKMPPTCLPFSLVPSIWPFVLLLKVGGRRGHDPSERKMVMSLLGSDPGRDPNTGSGFYSVEEFRKFLRFATERHVTVIPEFDMPSHSHAAIVSMKVSDDYVFDLLLSLLLLLLLFFFFFSFKVFVVNNRRIMLILKKTHANLISNYQPEIVDCIQNPLSLQSS